MNRGKVLTPHTSGSMTFARARHEWVNLSNNFFLLVFTPFVPFCH